MRKKRDWLFSLAGISICVIGILLRVFGDSANQKISYQEGQQMFFAIAPHFTIQPKSIERFYRTLKSIYAIDDEVNIVLISPDHFSANKESIAALCHDTKQFCYDDICLPMKAFPQTKISGCLAETGTKEHGLGEHFPFIKKIFPKANVYPIVVQPRKFIGNDELIAMLSGYSFQGKTLVIASVDFSHYVNEDFAQLHDRKSLYVLNTAVKASEYAAIEVDCPSCLHIINTLAQQHQQYPKLFSRDSSSTIANKDLGTGNTSRQFIYYTAEATGTNGFTVAFFGDLIFDRQVAKKLSGAIMLDKQFQGFFQQGNSMLAPENYMHRKLFGIDYIGLNLETPAVNNKDTCQHSNKEVTFCSNSSILTYLKRIGFTLMNVANNHSLDGGIAAHQETIDNIKSNGLNYMGYVRNGYFEKNYLWKTSIRGIKIARQGYDFTITPRNLFDRYCKILQQNKSEGYINMVSVHRGKEYETVHTAEQESLGKQLIDCGADVIIGHHPHVIQDIGRYQGKPIIYSLGNFLFDMNTEATKTGGYVLIDYQINNGIHLSTGTVNASVDKE